MKPLHPIAGGSFNHSIPVELFREVQLFSNEIDYYRWLSSMKLFADIKFQTRKIRLKHDEATKFLEDGDFRQLILSRIVNTSRQLCMKFKSLPKQVSSFDLLSITPLQTLDLLQCDSKLVGQRRWETFLSNKHEIRIGRGISFTVLPQQTALQLVFIRENDLLTDVTYFVHLKKVNFVHCCALSNIACLKNVECLRISSCPAVVDVSQLGNIPRLEIINCNGITDVSALTNNHRLYLEQCSRLRSFPIQFNGRWFFHDDPSVLHKISCPNLRFYDLRTSKTAPNILHGLALRFPKLFSVEVAYCDVICDVGGLKKVPVVKITSCNLLQDISGLGENKSVCIRYCNQITSFASLKNVNKVSIYGCAGFSNGYDVENVKELTLISLPQLSDARMLGNAHHLIIMQCKRLNKFEGLSNVPNLEIDGIHKDLGGPQQMRIVLYGIDRMSLKQGVAFFLSIHSDYDIFDDGSAVVLLRKREVGTVQSQNLSSSTTCKCNIM
jgi:hypothetical protein